MDIHLGGFVMGAPFWDDEFCAYFCNTYNILVVSLNYSKAPSVRFPVPSDDIISIAQAVLSDESLPIDKTRVVIGGISAGGNLALSAAQAPELRDRIHGAVCWCAITDWVTSTAEKLKTRPYRDPKQTDVLKSAFPAWLSGYIQPGHDLRDPKLSVLFAKRENLPKWLFFVGAEYDLLCHESKEMIMNLADVKGKNREDGKYGFEKGTYRWRMARNVVHGHTHYIPGETAVDKELRLKRREETFAEVGKWLLKGPFAEGPPENSKKIDSGPAPMKIT